MTLRVGSRRDAQAIKAERPRAGVHDDVVVGKGNIRRHKKIRPTARNRAVTAGRKGRAGRQNVDELQGVGMVRLGVEVNRDLIRAEQFEVIDPRRVRAGDVAKRQEGERERDDESVTSRGKPAGAGQNVRPRLIAVNFSFGLYAYMIDREAEMFRGGSRGRSQLIERVGTARSRLASTGRGRANFVTARVSPHRALYACLPLVGRGSCRAVAEFRAGLQAREGSNGCADNWSMTIILRGPVNNNRRCPGNRCSTAGLVA